MYIANTHRPINNIGHVQICITILCFNYDHTNEKVSLANQDIETRLP